ncbi:hypothetical protein PAPYR_3173 [Paratrimastix pyriformis]|uniref:Uncharacterized protein n=1 Tax=Paratrimastix pyriformis TaxID=342808 RepID=A0ABQ8US47_9EUKA|nr:hypothetical protein PAPYR_3173 [Paratrimastix pyriformis]
MQAVATIEKQAEASEQKIAELDQRLSQVETLISGAGGADEIRKYKQTMLEKLRDLRITIGADNRKATALEQSLKQLTEENERLKGENKALHYQVKTLVRSLNEEEAKVAQLSHH